MSNVLPLQSRLSAENDEFLSWNDTYPLSALPCMEPPSYRDLVDFTSKPGTLVNIYCSVLQESAEYYSSQSAVMRFPLSGKTRFGTMYNEEHEYVVCYTNDYSSLKSLLGSNLCIMLRRLISTTYGKSINLDTSNKYSKSMNLDISNNSTNFIDQWTKGFINGDIKYRGSYVVHRKRGSLIRTIYATKRHNKFLIKTKNSRLNYNPIYLASMLDKMTINIKELTSHTELNDSLDDINFSESGDIPV